MSYKSPASYKRPASAINNPRNSSSNVSRFSSKEASRDIPLDPSPLQKPEPKTSHKIPHAPRLGNMKVACRIRPLNKKEKELGDTPCIEVIDQKSLILKNKGAGTQGLQFTFDRVFNTDATQQEIYDVSAKPIVESVFDGFNGTVLVYGQSQTGKSFTLQGPQSEDPGLQGIVPRVVNNIFERIREVSEQTQICIKFSAIELYCEKIKDLLNPEKSNLKVRQDKNGEVVIEDLTEKAVEQEEDIMGFFKLNSLNKAKKCHLIFTIMIHQTNVQDLTARSGKLCLAELADSEKLPGTVHDFRTLAEVKVINKSLLALGNVIKMLSESRPRHHISYRDSNLTRILQESLGGNSKTSLIITCSLARVDYQETLATLKFGHRAKLINNAPKIIHRELTLPQLQRLFARAERDIEEKNKRIQSLENLLKEKGVFVSIHEGEDVSHFTDNKSENYKDYNLPSIMGELESHPDSEILKEDEDLLNRSLPSFSDIPETEDQEEIKELYKALEEEKQSMNTLNTLNENLQKELEEAKQSIMNKEEENRALLRKLSLGDMKIKGLQEHVRKRDEKIKSLEDLNNSLIWENEELQRKKNYLGEKVRAKDNEIERLSNLLMRRELKEINKTLELEGFAIIDTDFSKDLSEQINKVVQQIIKGAYQKYGRKDRAEEDKLPETVVEKLNSLIEIEGVSSAGKGKWLEIENGKLIKDNENLTAELEKKKEECRRLEGELEDLKEDYMRVIKAEFPSFEEIVQSMVKVAVDKQKNSSENERVYYLKSIQTRMETITKLETELEEQKQKNKDLQAKLDETVETQMKKLFDLQHRVLELQKSSEKKRARAQIEGSREKSANKKEKGEQISREEAKQKLLAERRMNFENLAQTLRINLSDSKTSESQKSRFSKNTDEMSNKTLEKENNPSLSSSKGQHSTSHRRSHRIGFGGTNTGHKELHETGKIERRLDFTGEA